MTLGSDDVEIAREWISGERGAWEDESVVRSYEREFASQNESRHAFATISGRSSLSLILQALDLPPGAEVLVPGYTCVVVPNAVRYAGLKPVYYDIELESFGPDAASLASRISDQTVAIVSQHLYGLVARDQEGILEVAEARGLPVVEDCAHIAGGRLHNRRVGNDGTAAFYSSEKSKPFNTVTGGIAVTNDRELADRMRGIIATMEWPNQERVEWALRTVPLLHARAKRRRSPEKVAAEAQMSPAGAYVSTPAPEAAGHRPEGYMARMAAPLAAVGRNQLQKLPRLNKRRRAVAGRWDRWCQDEGYKRPLVIQGSEPVFLRYPVLVEEARKRNLAWATRELGVKPGVWFKSHLHPAPGSVPGCPAADDAVRRCINLPTLLR